MKTLIFFVFITILTAGEQTLADNNWFSDNFNDGVLDTTHWQYGGNGISESGGVLNLDRDSFSDYIKTSYTYTGDFKIELDIKLNFINEKDPFHGITLTDSLNDSGFFNGFSLGFSRNNNKFYCAHGTLTQVDYYYGGSYTLGQWQHWALTRNGNNISVLVNGSQVISDWSHIPFGGTIPNTVRIYLPGLWEPDNYYSPTMTSSDVDNFSITPEPATLLLLGLGAAIAVRKQIRSKATSPLQKS